jgi:hypothetical protein
VTGSLSSSNPVSSLVHDPENGVVNEAEPEKYVEEMKR